MRVSLHRGKKDGVDNVSIPWYFLALAKSNSPYVALAGTLQGGLLPIFVNDRRLPSWKIKIVAHHCLD
jgi:hypothetical protein